MKTSRISIAAGALASAVALTVSGCSTPSVATASGATGASAAGAAASLPSNCKTSKPTIGVALPNTTNPYYIAMRQSFVDEAAQDGLNLKIAIANDSDSTQLSQVQSFIQDGVCAIAFNAVNSTPGASDVAAANRAGIPVFSLNVIVDPAALKQQNASIVEYVGPDQVQGGTEEGQAVLKDLGSSAKIVVGIGGDPQQIPTNERDSGFKAALAVDKSASVVTTVNTQVDPNVSLQVITEMLQGNPNINVVFADTGPAVTGAIQAIKQLGRTGKVSLYGFCAANTPLDGTVYKGCAAQEPAQYAQIATDNIKSYINGGHVSAIPHDRTTGSVLAAEGISRQYGHTLALAGVDLSLRSGEVHGIAGHNGAGKSTLLRILSGAEQPDTGRITLNGNPLRLAGPASALAAGIACVYQELSLAPNMTVAQNIFLGSETNVAGRVRDRQMNSETAQLLEEFGVPVRPTDEVSRLPVAQRQMVEILRALHRRATFVLLDEPTTALQPDQIDLLIKALRRIVAERDVAVAMIDHKIDELYAVADRITVLTDGKVVLSDTVDNAPRERLIDAIVGTGSRQARDALLSPAHAELNGAAPSAGETVLRLSGVETDRLHGVDLDVRRGQVHGIYGLVGSGRTRLLRTIIGVEPIRAGQLTLLGEPYRPSGPREAIKRGIAYVSEERKADGFIPGSDAYDNAALPVLSRYSRFGVIRRSAARQAAREVLQNLDIRGDVSGPIERLSGGNQQKALLGKALMQKPKVLLLDEPTKGIDIAAKAEIHGIIRDLAHRDGVAVIVVSSEEEEILAVSDQVAVMRGGRIDGPPTPVAQHSVLDLRRNALGQQVTSQTI